MEEHTTTYEMVLPKIIQLECDPASGSNNHCTGNTEGAKRYLRTTQDTAGKVQAGGGHCHRINPLGSWTICKERKGDGGEAKVLRETENTYLKTFFGY